MWAPAVIAEQMSNPAPRFIQALSAKHRTIVRQQVVLVPTR